jgi:hypothetical protein
MRKTHRFIAVGLAILAVLAVGAVSASASQAATFGSESSANYLKGEQTTRNVWTTDGGKWECTGARYEGGPVSGKEFSEVALHPMVTGCTMIGLPLSVNANGCTVNLSAASTAAIQCGAAPIEFTLNPISCKVTMGTQTPGKAEVSYTNVGSGPTAYVLLTWHLAGIAYTSSGGFCGASGTDGTLSGTVAIKDYSASNFKFQDGWHWQA